MCEILTLISPLELFLFKIVSGQLMPETTILILVLYKKSCSHLMFLYHMRIFQQRKKYCYIRLIYVKLMITSFKKREDRDIN